MIVKRRHRIYELMEVDVVPSVPEFYFQIHILARISSPIGVKWLVYYPVIILTVE